MPLYISYSYFNNNKPWASSFLGAPLHSPPPIAEPLTEQHYPGQGAGSFASLLPNVPCGDAAAQDLLGLSRGANRVTWGQDLCNPQVSPEPSASCLPL